MADIPVPIRVLHLEDSPVDHELVKFALRRDGLEVDILRVETLETFRQALSERRWDVVLADYHLQGFTALDAWEIMKEVADAPPFIILSGAIGEEAAADAIRRGMADYVLKNSMRRIQHVVLQAIEMSEVRRARERYAGELAESQRRLAALTEHLQRSIEEERTSIAREIHDDIGGSLAALKLSLAAIGRTPLDESARVQLSLAQEMVTHAVDASQRIMKNLRPAILDQGLEAAIEWLLAGFERRSGVKTRLHASLTGMDLPPAVSQVVFRTAQEALTNVGKHAQATQVAIELTAGGGVLMLEVSDNGRGLAAGAQDKPESFGLRGLRERARTVDGWLDVSTGPGGTTLILSIPLGGAAEGEERT